MYEWERTSAGHSVNSTCQFGGVIGDAGSMATRHCDEYGVWVDPDFSKCLTMAEAQFKNLTNVRVRTSKILHSVTICTKHAPNPS